MKKRQLIILQIVIIILVTAVAYFPSLTNGFTNWDDPDLILENTHIRSLSLKNMAAFFTASYGGFGGYTPLVFMSYALEYHFFQRNPRAFHATNLLLHILNCLLIYWFIDIIARKIWISFLVAMFFGVHPLHVEAVAWIQGRKDLLFSLFYLAALICFGLFLQKKRKRGYYILSLLLFMVSLFSKVTAVSFPLVILTLEFHLCKKLGKSSLIRSIPFFALSFTFLVLAFVTNKPGIPQASAEHISYLQNLGVFFYSFAFYISKIFLPIKLIARYSIHIGQYPWQLVLNLVIFALVCGLIYFIYQRKPKSVTFGVTFFILTLMPTLPFHFSGQPYADRYIFLPITGFLFIFAVFIDYILSRRQPSNHKKKLIAWSLLFLATLLLGGKTWILSRVWRDSISLWTYVLKKDPRNATAYVDRGEALADLNQLDKAMADFNQAEKFNPKNPNIYNNRGVIYFKREEFEKALKEYNRALSQDPRYYVGYYNRGTLWGRLGEFEKAIHDYTIALELNKNSYNAYYYRGVSYKKLNLIDPAIADFKAAYDINATEQARNQLELLFKLKNQQK